MILASIRHAIIACRYLVGASYENRYIPAPEMTEHYHMNIRALMPGLSRLTRTGILRSRVGGTEAGFIFCSDPQKIQMINVITALECERQFVCCRDVIPGIKCDCKGESEYKIYRIMSLIILTARVELGKILMKDYWGNKQENNLKAI